MTFNGTERKLIRRGDIPPMPGDDKHGDVVFLSCMYGCPTCGERYRLRTVMNDIDKGIVQTIVKLPCGHSFVLMFDKKGSVRSYTEIDDITVAVDRIDVDYLRRQEKILIEKHKALVDDRQDVDAFKMHEQIKAVRKEIALLERDDS